MKNNKGAALLLTLASLLVVTFIVVELVFDTSVNYIVSSRKVYKVQAKYAARSAMKLALLRIYYYESLSTQSAALANTSYASYFMVPYPALALGRLSGKSF